MSTASFSSWWLANFLASMGYPKKRGFFRTETVSSQAISAAIETLQTIAVGIGAGRPQASLSLFAATFGDRDWSIPLDDFLSALRTDYEEPSVRTLMTGIERVHSEVQWTSLGDEEFQGRLAWNFGACLWFGLVNSDSFEDHFDERREAYDRSAGTWRSEDRTVGLGFPWATVDDLYADIDTYLDGFERETGALTVVPIQLAERPEAQNRFSTSTPAAERCQFMTDIEPSCVRDSEFALKISPQADGSTLLFLCATHASSVRTGNPLIPDSDWLIWAQRR